MVWYMQHSYRKNAGTWFSTSTVSGPNHLVWYAQKGVGGTVSKAMKDATAIRYNRWALGWAEGEGRGRHPWDI